MSDQPEYVYHTQGGEEIEQRKKDALLRLKAREGERFWDRCLRDPVGRGEIWKLLSDLGTFRTDFRFGPAGIPDEFATWWSRGRSDFGRDLSDFLMKASLEGWVEMMRAHNPRLQPEPVERPNAQPEVE